MLIHCLYHLIHCSLCFIMKTSCAGGRHNVPRPCKLTFDILTLKVVFESRDVGYVPILVSLGLSFYRLFARHSQSN